MFLVGRSDGMNIVSGPRGGGSGTERVNVTSELMWPVFEASVSREEIVRIQWVSFVSVIFLLRISIRTCNETNVLSALNYSRNELFSLFYISSIPMSTNNKFGAHLDRQFRVTLKIYFDHDERRQNYD